MDQKTMQHAEKAVMAAMKIMYAPQTRQTLEQAVQATAAQNPKALALNAVGIIKMLFDRSQGKLPPNIIPMVTMLLLYEIASFTGQTTGKKIPPEVVKQAVPIAMQMLKQVFAQQIARAQGAKQTPQAPQTPPAPPAPQQPGGLINQPMGA